MNKKGQFIISLDFELMWGVFDSKSEEHYKENILGAKEIIPQILELFNTYNISATWATVGFLFFENFQELNNRLPDCIPIYLNGKYNVYDYLSKLSDVKNSIDLHFAKSLIELIRNNPSQEIATHTFSHYYCLEEGPGIEAFENDVEQSIKIAKELNIEIKSIVFPRNQYNQKHIEICYKHGVTSYRGNPDHKLYLPRKKEQISFAIRLLRLLDSYLNISGHKCHSKNPNINSCINVAASDFLRPFSKKLQFFESLKINRIKKSMTYAAKNNLMYHLWWHPHNFGINKKQNLKNLEELLKHFEYLHKQYNFESVSMNEYAKRHQL